MQLDHTRAPLYEAMKEYQLDRVVKSPGTREAAATRR